MENFSQLGEDAAAAARQRGAGSGFMYGGSVLGPSSYGRTGGGESNHIGTGFHLQPGGSGGECYGQSEGHPHTTTVKSEGGSTSHHHHHHQMFQYPLMIRDHHHHHHHRQQESAADNNLNEVDAMKAKIIAHPQYSNLLEAYMDCQKV